MGLRERTDIQEWVAAHPDILGGDLLIIAKEFSGFDSTSERLDLLAVDSQGTLVVIELKRDDSGADAYWQAVKYASYLRHANVDTIAEMLADYAGISKEDAGDRLLKHLDADDFESLNREQRIILASHRFAPEVTSAVLWLNEKFAGESLITCVQLTPYHDDECRFAVSPSQHHHPIAWRGRIHRAGGVEEHSSGEQRKQLSGKAERDVCSQ